LLRVAVAEHSMEPALRPGDWLLIRRTRRVRAGQIVLARHPGRPAMLLVKRAVRQDGSGWWLESDNPNGMPLAGGLGGSSPQASTAGGLGGREASSLQAGAVDSRRFGAVVPGLIVGTLLVRYRRGRRAEP